MNRPGCSKLDGQLTLTGVWVEATVLSFNMVCGGTLTVEHVDWDRVEEDPSAKKSKHISIHTAYQLCAFSRAFPQEQVQVPQEQVQEPVPAVCEVVHAQDDAMEVDQEEVEAQIYQAAVQEEELLAKGEELLTHTMLEALGFGEEEQARILDALQIYVPKQQDLIMAGFQDYDAQFVLDIAHYFFNNCALVAVEAPYLFLELLKTEQEALDRKKELAEGAPGEDQLKDHLKEETLKALQYTSVSIQRHLGHFDPMHRKKIIRLLNMIAENKDYHRLLVVGSSLQHHSNDEFIRAYKETENCKSPAPSQDVGDSLSEVDDDDDEDYVEEKSRSKRARQNDDM